MDVLYTGDIPSEYHYAIFNNGYIDLYNSPVLHNDTYTRYRVYTNVNGFYYSTDSVPVNAKTLLQIEIIIININIILKIL